MSRDRGDTVRRRSCLLAGALAALPALPSGAADAVLRQAMRRAEAARDEAVRAGDQPYGAVVLRDGVLVAVAPSRVVTAGDPTAHAEMEALRAAARALGSRELAGAVLVSTSRPCRMCESAAAAAGISRMVHGPDLTDAGAPR
jgi:tRNA(Arg) A34 adenosine deaminase TadA